MGLLPDNCSKPSGDTPNDFDLKFWDDTETSDAKIDASSILGSIADGIVNTLKSAKAGLLSLFDNLSMPSFDFDTPGCDAEESVMETTKTDVTTSVALAETSTEMKQSAEELPASTVRDLSTDPVVKEEVVTKMEEQGKTTMKAKVNSKLGNLTATGETSVQDKLSTLA